MTDLSRTSRQQVQDAPRGGFARPVLVVGPTPPPYQGVSVCMETAMGVLKAQNIPFVHLDMSDRRPLDNIDRVDWGNITLGIKQLFGYYWKLLVNRPSLVYFPICQTKLGFLRDAAFLLPTRLLGKTMLLHMHGARFRRIYDSSGWFLRTLVRLMLGGKSHMIVLGLGLRGLFDGLVRPENIHVAANGIDLPDFGPSHENRSPQADGKLRVLFFGALTAAKGVHDALRAVGEAAKMSPNVEFVFAGGFRYPSDESLAMQIVRETGLEGRVTFHGVTHGAQKAALFSQGDIFLFPSHDEGQPVVLLEAMAAGLSIVTTNVGAIAETVLNEHNGLVVPAHDVPAIVVALKRLIGDAALRNRFARASRQRYLDLYTGGCFARRLKAIILQVLGGNP